MYIRVESLCDHTLQAYMQAQLAAKRAVVAVTWTQARVRDLTAMEHSISYTLQKVGRPRSTLKLEQRECIEHMYEGKDVIVWLPTGFVESLFPEILTKNDRESTCASSAGVYVMVFTPTL